jgi:hypothetical protein
VDDLRDLYEAQKTLSGRLEWYETDNDCLTLRAPLDIGGATMAGLRISGYAHTHLLDEAVRFQLEFRAPHGKFDPMCRYEWRPLSGHNNKGRGPQDLQWKQINGTHVHPFEMNFADSIRNHKRHNLRIAVPVTPEPTNYSAMLASVGNEFRIIDMTRLPRPPWQPRII